MSKERTASPGSPPQYWSQATDGAGRTVLTYAVRSGTTATALGALGVACVLGGVWGAWYLLGGGLTIAGVIFLILVPGGAIAFGVHCLDAVLVRRDEYVMSSHGLTARHISVWGGGKPTEIPRHAVSEVRQGYSPPGNSSSQGSPGTWTTFLAWRDKSGRERELAFEGMGTPHEARWLGPLMAEWAGKPLKRAFGAGFEEADPQELPTPE